MKAYPSVAIIIVNWNGRDLLSTCLNSLTRKTTYPNYHVVVVDNGSLDNSSEFLRDRYPEAIRILLDKNYGFAVGNNIGIVYAQRNYDPDYVLLLNNDTEIIQAHWLNKIIETTESDNEIGIAGCKLIYPDGSAQNIGTKIGVRGPFWLDPNTAYDLPEVFEVDAVYGACFLIRRMVIERIGLLDEGFSPFLYEETDYCVRAKRAGYKNCTISSVMVVHARSASTRKVKSHFAIFVERKNTIRFMLLNFPIAWIILRIPIEIATFFSILERNKDKKGVFPFKLRRREELVNRIRTNTWAWRINLKNLRDIIAKRRNRTGKLMPINS